MSDPDWEVVKRCQTGQGKAFEEAYEGLYDLYKNRVYTICLRVTGNEEDALDAAQETMVTLARRIKDFAFRSRFSSWVYRIAVNAAIDIRRRRLDSPHGAVTVVSGLESGGHGDPVADPELVNPSIQVASAEYREAVRRALTRINERFSVILTLRYIQGLTYEEIAEVLDCHLGTVKSRLNRAHSALREHLSRQMGEDLANP